MKSINIESNLNIPKITKSPAIKIPSIGNYKVDFIMDDGSSFSQDVTVSKVASLVRKTANN